MNTTEIKNIKDLLYYELNTTMIGVRFHDAVNSQILYKKDNGEMILSKFADERFQRMLLNKTMKHFSCNREEAFRLYGIVKQRFIDFKNNGYCDTYYIVDSDNTLIDDVNDILYTACTQTQVVEQSI